MKKIIVLSIFIIICIIIFFYLSKKNNDFVSWSMLINDQVYLQINEDDKIINIVNLSDDKNNYNYRNKSYDRVINDVNKVTFFNLIDQEAKVRINNLDQADYELQQSGLVFLRDYFFNIVPIPKDNQSQFDKLDEIKLGKYINLYYSNKINELINIIKKDTYIDMNYTLAFSNPAFMDIADLTRELKVILFWMRNEVNKEIETYYDQVIDYGVSKIKLGNENLMFNNLVINENYQFKYIKSNKYNDNYNYLLNYQLIKDYEINIKPKLNPNNGQTIEDKLIIMAELKDIIVLNKYPEYNLQIEVGIMNQASAIIDLINIYIQKNQGINIHPLCPKINKSIEPLIINYQNINVKETLNTLLNQCQIN